MKKAVFHISFIIFTCLSINVGFSANYYIDAISGSDDNVGTSTAQAWKTIDKVNSMVFQPGDSILFHRGQSWIGKIAINYSGNSAQPIVFSSYATGEHPVIKGSTSADSSGFWINIGNGLWESSIPFSEEISVLFYNTNDSLPLRAKKENTLDDLDELWDFHYDPLSQKVILYAPSDNPAELADGIEIADVDYGIHIGDNCSYITISNLKLLYFADDGIYTHTPGVGLMIDHNIIANIGGPGSVVFHGNGIFIHFLYPNDTITIINNETYNIWHIGIFVPVGPTVSELYGSRICHNHLVMTGGSAIGVRYAIGIEVSDNYIHKASVYITDRCGIGIENCDYMTVNNNIISEAVDDGSSPYSGWLSAGIYTFGANHCQFYYNIVSEGVVGIHLDDDDGTYGYTSVGNEICYNLCYNHIGIGIMVEQENDSTLVYNNTTFNCLHAGISFRGWAAGNSDYCSVKNNIVCNQMFSNNVIEIVDIGINFQMDYNCFYHSDPSANLVHWLGNDYTSSQFEYYQDFSGQDINSINDNPLFMNIDSADFALNAYSPCIDAGTTLGLEHDITGYPVPFGDAVDMGAYEFNDTITHIKSFLKSESSNFQVFPNPCRDKINILIKSGIWDIVNYSLSNYAGETLYEGQKRIQHGDVTFEINLSGLAVGVYFIRMIAANKKPIIKKLVKL